MLEQIQHQRFRCSQCKITKFNVDTPIYICCYPIKINKIHCIKCVGKAKCQHCKFPKDNHSKLANHKIQLKEVQMTLSNLPIQKRFNKKSPQIIQQSSPQTCLMCDKDFQKYQINSYLHFKCSQKQVFCYPCLYIIFLHQIQMFDSEVIQEKKQYNLVMPCCDEPGQNILQFQKRFHEQLCVFCGKQYKLMQQSDKKIIRINYLLTFDVKCFIKEKKMIKFTENEQETSSYQIVQFIRNNYTKKCWYCDKQIQIYQLMSYFQVRAMNYNLCSECCQKTQKKKKKLQQAIKQYKSLRIKSKIKNGQIPKCCQKQCQQQLIYCKQSNKQSKVQFYVFQWKDGQTYCMMCLYFKFEQLKRELIKDIKNKLKIKKTKCMADKLIDRLKFEYQSYEHRFSENCMICGRSNHQELACFKCISPSISLQNYVKEFQLTCSCCSQCFKYLITQSSKKEGKYKMLYKMKQEMIDRDPNFKNQLIQQKKKIDLLKEQKLQSKPKEGSMFLSLISICTSSPEEKLKNKKMVTIKQANHKNSQGYGNKPIGEMMFQQQLIQQFASPKCKQQDFQTNSQHYQTQSQIKNAGIIIPSSPQKNTNEILSSLNVIQIIQVVLKDLQVKSFRQYKQKQQQLIQQLQKQALKEQKQYQTYKDQFQAQFNPYYSFQQQSSQQQQQFQQQNQEYIFKINEKLLYKQQLKQQKQKTCIIKDSAEKNGSKKNLKQDQIINKKQQGYNLNKQKQILNPKKQQNNNLKKIQCDVISCKSTFFEYQMVGNICREHFLQYLLGIVSIQETINKKIQLVNVDDFIQQLQAIKQEQYQPQD